MILSNESSTSGTQADDFLGFRSQSTVSTPCEERGEGVYCRTPDTTIRISDVGGREHGVPVGDVVSFSDSVLYLLTNGDIIRESDTRLRCSSNIRPHALESYGGDLYAIASGSLYVLNTGSFDTRSWIWEPCSWAPIGITSSSTTLDGSHLWLQAENNGFLYDTNRQVVATEQMGTARRIYGRTRNHYLDLDPLRHTAIRQPGNVSYRDLLDATFTNNDDLVPLELGTPFNRVRLIRWKPYFFVQHREL